jgi:quinol monooxygenase YgiN
MSKVALFIKTKTQSGKRDKVKWLWERHLKPGAEKNPLQEIHVFCFDGTDKDTLYLFEVYSSQEALQQAGQSPAFGAYLQEVMPLLAGPPEMSVTTPLWAKGISV